MGGILPHLDPQLELGLWLDKDKNLLLHVNSYNLIANSAAITSYFWTPHLLLLDLFVLFLKVLSKTYDTESIQTMKTKTNFQKQMITLLHHNTSHKVLSGFISLRWCLYVTAHPAAVGSCNKSACKHKSDSSCKYPTDYYKPKITLRLTTDSTCIHLLTIPK